MCLSYYDVCDTLCIFHFHALPGGLVGGPRAYLCSEISFFVGSILTEW